MVMNINDRIVCKVTGIQSYGVFVSCKEYSGLVHISEISEQYVSSLDDFIKIGDDIDVSILEIDESNKRLKLSYKQAHPIHPKIKKQVKVKIGFHTLDQALPHWIEKTKK